MSGGKFDYRQESINYIVDELAHLIAEYEKTGEYKYATIEAFKEGLWVLRVAYTYAKRIDWLLSGDDSEKDFQERLVEDLQELAKKT
jgi:hypothetical protein